MMRSVLFLMVLVCTVPAHADVRSLLQLVDYLGVDYAGAVEQGTVINEFEYAEMVEFSGRIQAELAQLPVTTASDELSTLSSQLVNAVTQKVELAQIAGLTQQMRQLLMSNYDIVLTPRAPPDMQRVAALYNQYCSSCHGEQGLGDGLAAQGLDPAPTDFQDAERARQRSLFGLYNTITLGVDGTSMAGRPDLSDADRWALAFYVGSLFADESMISQGRSAWQQSPLSLHQAVTMTPAELESERANGAALAAWVRQHPDVLYSGKNEPLDVAERNLASSLVVYRDGDRITAENLAVSAYLEGYEVLEAPLSNIDPALMLEAERAMMAYRQAIVRGAPVETVEAQYEEVSALMDRVRIALSGDALSPSVAFSGSLIILLREGLEVILVLAAMIAFLTKSNRTDALKYIHAGWILALLAGAATWALSSYLFNMSGATREITEGATALLAAVILLYVGFWMHRNASAQRWNKYLQTHIETALTARTLWTLGFVSFLAVYREVFETILFYQALWAQVAEDAKGSVVYGGVVALALLLLCTWTMIRFGKYLPLKLFFRVSAILMILLAFIFTGKGIIALQEAGSIPTDPVSLVPTISWLGIYPNAQVISMQVLVILITLGMFMYDNYKNRTTRA